MHYRADLCNSTPPLNPVESDKLWYHLLPDTLQGIIGYQAQRGKKINCWQWNVTKQPRVKPVSPHSYCTVTEWPAWQNEKAFSACNEEKSASTTDLRFITHTGSRPLQSAPSAPQPTNRGKKSLTYWSSEQQTTAHYTETQQNCKMLMLGIITQAHSYPNAQRPFSLPALTPTTTPPKRTVFLAFTAVYYEKIQRIALH